MAKRPHTRSSSAPRRRNTSSGAPKKVQRIVLSGVVEQALSVGRMRLLFVGTLYVCALVAITARLVVIGVGGMADQHDKGPRLHQEAQILARAEIRDREGQVLAMNMRMPSLYAHPKEIIDIHEAVEAVVRVFPDMSHQALYRMLDGSRKFAWIKRHISPKQQAQIHEQGIPGFYFAEEEKRVYPHGELFAHVLGAVNVDNKGIVGIERFFDDTLHTQADHLDLTLDMRVQSIVVDALAEAFEEYQAQAAAAVVMDAKTGEVLSLVSLPAFNPNAPKTIQGKAAFNHATKALYEMGSTFKAFTHALALESGMMDLHTQLDARKPLKISRFTIRDHHPKKRWLSLPEVLMYSSNIGAARMADHIGAPLQKAFMEKLHLLDGLLIDLPEVASPLYPGQWQRTQSMTISYGHGIAVTPLHVAAALAPLVNGGLYYMPTLVKGRMDQDPQRVISSHTSDKMRSLLHAVVEQGTGGRAQAEGYWVGGKTGTAEKPSQSSYDKTRMVTSFAGAFPIYEPRYVVVVVMDEPKGNENTFGYATAGFTAAPVVKAIVERAAPVLGVVPVPQDDPVMEARMALPQDVLPAAPARLAALQ